MGDGCCWLKRRLIEEKELVRLMETERKSVFVDQKRVHDAEVKELVAQSENRLTTLEARSASQEGWAGPGCEVRGTSFVG